METLVLGNSGAWNPVLCRNWGFRYAANLTTKRTQPSYSMGARNKDLTRAATPGPKYNIRSETKQVRGGTFGVKHSQCESPKNTPHTQTQNSNLTRSLTYSLTHTL